jgi:hypothetical protein
LGKTLSKVIENVDAFLAYHKSRWNSLARMQLYLSSTSRYIVLMFKSANHVFHGYLHMKIILVMRILGSQNYRNVFHCQSQKAEVYAFK